MIPIVLLPLVALAVQSSSNQAGGSRPVEPTVIKIYDISSALPVPLGRGQPEPLLPYLSPHETHAEGEIDPWFGADALIELFRNLCGEEFDYEGRELRFEGNGRMIVKAPPAIQAKTERYLAFLEGVFGASTELWIDAVELQEGGDASSPALISASEVDKVLARAGKGGVRSWRLQLQAGATARLDLTRVASMVTDYNVEVAQAAGIADPIVEDVPVGTRILARAAPAEGGMWLSLILRRGDPLSEVIDREIPIQNSVTTQDRVVSHDAARAYQTVEVLNRSLALNTYLPEGKALAIQSTWRSSGRPRVETLLVRRGSGALPIFRRASLDPKVGTQGGDVLFVNVQSAEPPRCEIGAAAMRADALPRSWSMIRSEDADVWASFPEDSFDVLRDLIGAGHENLQIRDVGPYLFLTRDPRERRERTASDAAGDEFFLPRKEGDGMDVLARYAPAGRVVGVSVVLRKAGAADPVARCTLPLRPGEPGCAVLGTEGIEIADYDVEVAQSASIADSVMRVGFDGIAVWLKPTFAVSGDLTLEIVARAHVRRGERRELDLNVPSLGKVDESTYDQLFARERLVFGKGDGARRRYILGDSSAQPGIDSLALEVEAAEIK